MENIIKILTDNIIVIVSTTVVPIMITLVRKEFKKIVVELIKTFFRAFTGKTLLSHHLFDTGLLYIESAKSINFDKGCDKKNRLFQALITAKTETVLEYCKGWVDTNANKVSKFSLIQLQTEFKKVLREIVELYEDKIKENFFKVLRNDEEVNTMYNIIYLGRNAEGKKEDGIGFKNYHEQNIKHIDMFIADLIVYSTLHNKKLVFLFLSEIDTALRIAVRDLKEVFESKNGRLC